MWIAACLIAGAVISFGALKLLWRKVPPGWKWISYEPFAWAWVGLSLAMAVVLILIFGWITGRIRLG